MTPLQLNKMQWEIYEIHDNNISLRKNLELNTTPTGNYETLLILQLLVVCLMSFITSERSERSSY